MMSLSMSIASSSNLTVSSVNNLFYSSKPKPQFHGIRIPQVCPKPIPLIRASPKNSDSLVVIMAKERRRIEQTRLKTTEQINEEIIDLKGELFMLRLQSASRQRGGGGWTSVQHCAHGYGSESAGEQLEASKKRGCFCNVE
ncbi:hypothetical protein LguiA_016102 [Lonicera macranthoides]